MSQSALISTPALPPRPVAAALRLPVVGAAALWGALVALAWWFVTVPQLFHVEAMARTVDRWIVLRDARWESLGVVLTLPPLPTMLHALGDLALVALPHARAVGFATQLVSVSAAVGAAVALLGVARQLE
ncbi:MAG: hypothetical protein NZ518_03610, partial [Dehalococcoidia bacterium]|nr:hypothetical protein [Dehalococcoidia bacterium]